MNIPETEPNCYPWQPFTGELEPDYYDALTKDGRVYRDCWHDKETGYFHARNHDVVPGEEVEYVRFEGEIL